jgi:two-component system response regulator FixJ
MIDPPSGTRAIFGAATVSPAGDLPNEAGSGAGPLICVVDDDESVRDSCRTLLESLGFAVSTYASGRDILADELHRRASCFIVDQHMPEMDGLATLGALRCNEPAAQSILVTGRLDPVIIGRAAALQIGAILEKPFSVTRLLELIPAPRGPTR